MTEKTTDRTREIVAALADSDTFAAGLDYLVAQKLLKADLIALAKRFRIDVRGRDAKEVICRRIVEATVGPRADRLTIREILGRLPHYAIEVTRDGGRTWYPVDVPWRGEGAITPAEHPYYYASAVESHGADDPAEIAAEVASFYKLADHAESSESPLWRVRVWIGEPAGRAADGQWSNIPIAAHVGGPFAERTSKQRGKNRLPAGLDLYRNGNGYRIVHTHTGLPLHGAYWRTQRDLLAAAAHLPVIDWTADKAAVVAALGTGGEEAVRRLLTPTRAQMPTWIAERAGALVKTPDAAEDSRAEHDPVPKATPRQAAQAVEILGPERTAEILGSAGIAGASPEQLAQLAATAAEDLHQWITGGWTDPETGVDHGSGCDGLEHSEDESQPPTPCAGCRGVDPADVSGNPLPAGRAVTVAGGEPMTREAMDELEVGFTRTYRGQVLRTWINEADGRRWYEVSMDYTGQVVSRPANDITSSDDQSWDELHNTYTHPVIFEVDSMQNDDRWAHEVANFSGSDSYDPADLADTAEKIAFEYADRTRHTVRVSVIPAMENYRRDHPDHYAYTTADPAHQRRRLTERRERVR